MNLDDVIPNPEYRMCRARAVAAPRTVVWDKLHRVTMSELPLGWTLEAFARARARLFAYLESKANISGFTRTCSYSRSHVRNLLNISQ